MSPRRIPTKAELTRLQKLYRTDQRIAEVLGNGVTEHLVAYWRRKKGVAKYSFPKFSEKDINEVWDRFGDDFNAGMELGISKAAFYNWRRRYKITKKPEALKLEQLTLELYTNERKRSRGAGTGQQTIAQKILAQHLKKNTVDTGETVEVEPDMVIIPAHGDRVLEHFLQSGTSYVWNPNRIIIPLDGLTGGSVKNVAEVHRAMRDFARRQQIKNFFDIGEGNPRQVVIEKGLLLPGQFSLDSDDHATTLGCLGALALAVGPEEMSSIWIDGKLTITVPETIRITIEGKPPRGVFVRDIAHYIVAHVSGSGVPGKIIEFHGGGVEHMSLSERITLCHIASASGAAGAICPFDATTRRYVNPRARRPFTPIVADRNADYTAEYSYDVNTMHPVACGPRKIEAITPIEELAGILIRQVYIGGIANGRFDDLKIVGEILKGKRVNEDVRLMIQPASRAVYLEALKKGIIRVFIEAGVIMISPGSPLFSGWLPLLEEERGLTTYFDTAFDTGDGVVYQVSPATAAASALSGQITDPSGYVKM